MCYVTCDALLARTVIQLMGPCDSWTPASLHPQLTSRGLARLLVRCFALLLPALLLPPACACALVFPPLPHPHGGFALLLQRPARRQPGQPHVPQLGGEVLVKQDVGLEGAEKAQRECVRWVQPGGAAPPQLGGKVLVKQRVGLQADGGDSRGHKGRHSGKHDVCITRRR